jgi:flagellar motor protein MotB
MRRTSKKRHIEEHEESWAVSYADLLMVLMSFFIVFFNIESGKGENENELIDIISKPFKTGEASEYKGRELSGNKKSGDVSTLAQLQKELKGLNINTFGIDISGKTIRSKNEKGLSSDLDKKDVSTLAKMRGLLVELPNDVFNIGSYKMNSEIEGYIDSILDKVSNYSEKVTIVAIGHSDSIPMKAGKKVVDSNFVLSSLRASKAVEYIVSKGYDKNWVFGQAVSVENRATRSLTLKIHER